MHHLHVRKERKQGVGGAQRIRLCACILAPSREQAAALQGIGYVVREARVMGPVKVSQEFQLQELCSETEVISQITSAKRCKKLGMKLESQLAPGCGNVPSAWLQRPFFWWVPPLGV